MRQLAPAFYQYYLPLWLLPSAIFNFSVLSIFLQSSGLSCLLPWAELSSMFSVWSSLPASLGVEPETHLLKDTDKQTYLFVL